MILRGARVYCGSAGFYALDLRLKNNRIAELGERLDNDDIEQISGYLIPGMIDVHTHGHAGVDVMQGESAVCAMSAAYIHHGITAFLPTTMNASIEKIAFAVDGISRAIDSAQGARVLGAHVEGPFICRRYRGAQAESAILPPAPAALNALCDRRYDILRMLTLAPELPGARETIEHACAHGIVISIGHTAATYEQAIQGLDWGATQFTHLYNAMPSIHHRIPGVPVAALLDSRATVQIIADGVHVNPAILQLTARLKKEGICLITDSMMAAGLSDGVYSLGGQSVYVRNGEARLADDTLAGSTLTLDEALRRMVRFANLPLENVVAMVTEIPAKSLHLTDAGRIVPGYRADLCLLNDALQPTAVWLNGQKKSFGH